MNIAHYPGNVTDLPPNAYYGADTAGAHYRPIEATHDAETDRTTIRFRPIAPADMREFTEPHMEQIHRKVELMELFGGSF